MSAIPSAGQALRFGRFRLDPERGEVRKDRRPVKIQPQPFRVLALLASRAGEVVTREEIKEELWSGDTFVDFEHGINYCINQIRTALGDDPEKPQFVQTVPRKGYRFLAHVEGEAPPHRQPHRRALLALGGVLTAALAGVVWILIGGLDDRGQGEGAAPIQSLAVLPLENLSGDPEQEYFSDGMTEALISNLGKIETLTVISRTSAMGYKDTDKPLPDIAQELNVDALVEGSVLRAEKQVRITVRLVEAATDRQRWSESYQRDLQDILALQSEVARAIAREIQIAVSPEEEMRLASARPVNPEAHEAYLKGVFFRNKFSRMERAIEYFKEALDKDPDYALAQAELAQAFLSHGMNGFTSPREAGPKAKAAALKALEMDETLGEAHRVLARLFHNDWDWSAAEREYERAIELSPGHALSRTAYASYLSTMGRADEALAQAKRAREMDPLGLLINANFAKHLFKVDRDDEAIVLLRSVLEMDPDYYYAHRSLCYIFKHKEMYEESLAECKAQFAARGNTEVVESLEQGYAESGYRGAMRSAAEKMVAQSKESYVNPTMIGAMFFLAEDPDRGFEWHERAYEERDWWLPAINSRFYVPLFDSRRSDPRYQSLLRRMGIPE